MNKKLNFDVKFIEIAAVFFCGVFLGCLPLFFYHGFYFLDDMQHQYMPVFYNIGRSLRSGELPLISLNNWYGGNFLGESQYALFNPVSLFIYFILPSFASIAQGAAFMACFYYGILCSGFYFLCRSYGITRPAALIAAIAITTNNFIAYWYAGVWIPIFIGLAWSVWGWAFLRRSEQSRWDFILAIFFAYLTLSLGYPLIDLFFGFVVFLILFEKWIEKNYEGLLSTAIIGLIGVLISTASIFPLASLKDLTSRSSQTFNYEALVPNLHDVLTLSFPIFYGFMTGLSRPYQLFHTPLFYCAWFIIPMLPFLAWRKFRLERSTVGTLIAGAGILLLATQGPESLYSIRWPVRLIPFFHLFVLLLFFKLFDPENFKTNNRHAYISSFFLLALTVIMAWQKEPEHFAWFIVLVLLISWVISLVIARKSAYGLYAILALSSLFFFIDTRILINKDPMFSGGWGMPSHQGAHPLTNITPSAYTFYLGNAGDALDTPRLNEFQTGNMPLEFGSPNINGYSPVGHKYLQKVFCFTGFGETCPSAAGALFSSPPLPDDLLTQNEYPEVDAPLVDLMRVNRIIAMKGDHLSALMPYVQNWHLEFDGKYTQRFVRHLPNDHLSGTVSWVSPGVSLLESGGVHARREEINLKHSGDRDVIIFARLWWPGYKASYNDIDVPVVSYKGILVAVRLPAQPRNGTLVLSYRPPYMILSFVMAFLGCGLAIGWLAIGMNVSRRWLGRSTG